MGMGRNKDLTFNEIREAQKVIFFLKILIALSCKKMPFNVIAIFQGYNFAKFVPHDRI